MTFEASPEGTSFLALTGYTATVLGVPVFQIEHANFTFDFRTTKIPAGSPPEFHAIGVAHDAWTHLVGEFSGEMCRLLEGIPQNYGQPSQCASFVTNKPLARVCACVC